MDMLFDAWGLPGAIGRSLTGGHGRSDSVATDDNESTMNQPASILDPLRKALRTSRGTGRPTKSRLVLPETPQNPIPHSEQPENKGYRIQVLKAKIEQAENYSEWLAAATELDDLEGHDAWKLVDESNEYDYQIVRSRLKHMDNTRISRDQRKIFKLIRTGLTRGLGGMGSLQLYKHSRIGTKALIERYIESTLETIDAFVEITKNGHGPLDHAYVMQELLLTRQAFGRSALLLSGGGTFGMNHIGVIKCLFEANLLPRIISGASAGSIVSAVLCTKTDDEIPQVLEEFCYGDLAVFEKEGEETSVFGKAYRFLTQGSLFDITNLISVMKNLLGDMTFFEAHNRTRRILNICVSTASLFELPRLLNYITAPNVLIWSAVAASCSVPLVFDPAQLLIKDPQTGEERPWNTSPNKWIDGSVENDVPMQRLSEMFNVNHFIVSQVNPHVVPFLEKDEHDVAKQAQRAEKYQKTGPTWGQKLTGLAKDEAMQRLHVLESLGVLPNVMSKIRAVVGQRYSGDITIFPHVSYADFPYVLSNPTSDFMIAATLSGERATWPKLSEIRNHCAIELAIDDAVHQLMSNVLFGQYQMDAHSLATLGFPMTMSAEKQRQLTKRPSYKTVRTSLDLPRLALKAPELKAGGGSDTTATTGNATNGKPKKIAGPDLHDFSDSDSEANGGEEDEWNLSDDEYSDDSSKQSPPSPSENAWPSARQLFPWASQPTTPSLASKSFAFTPAVQQMDTPMTPSAPMGAAPSSPELQYKRLFHQGPITTMSPAEGSQLVNKRSKSVMDLDVSGARGMARRKMSLSLAPPTPGTGEKGRS